MTEITSSITATKPWWRQPTFLLVVVIGSLYFCTGRASLYGGDDLVTLSGARNWLVAGQQVYASGDTIRPVKWPVVQSLLLMPMASLLDEVSARPPQALSQWAFLWFLHALSTATVIAQAILIVLIGRRFRLNDGICYLAALGFAFSTYAWPAAQRQYSDPTQAVFVCLSVWGLLAFLQSGRAWHLVWCGIAVGLSINTKATGPGYGGLLGLVLLVELIRRWRREPVTSRTVKHMLAFGLPIVVLWSIAIGYSWYVGEYWTPAGHVDEYHFTNPLAIGLFGTLLSPGKGLLFYAPMLFFAAAGTFCLWRRQPAVTLTICLICFLNLLVHSKFYHWASGWYWGPRYQLAVLPLLCLLVAGFWQAVYESRHALRKRLAIGASVAVLGVGVVIQIPGLLTVSNDYYAYHMHWTVAVDLYPQQSPGPTWPMMDEYIILEFVPHFSPIAGQWWIARCLAAGEDWRDAFLRPPWRSLNERWVLAPPAEQPFSWGIWWLEALRTHHPHRVTAVVLVLLAMGLCTLAGIPLARHIRRQLRAPPAPAEGA